MSLRVPYTTARGRFPVWLLDLDIGGHVVRVATEPVSVTGNDGTTWRYRTGLRLPPITFGQDLDSVAIEIDDGTTDWALHVARAGQLDRQYGELRLWYEDAPGGRGKVVFSGGISRPEYGDPNAPTKLSCTLVATLSDSPKLYPPENEVVSTDTFNLDMTGATDSCDPNILGQPYVTVIGRPGNRIESQSNPVGASVGLVVTGTSSTRSRIMISRGEVAATSVNIWVHADEYPEGDEQETHTVSTGTDALGNTYSYIGGWPTTGAPARSVLRLYWGAEVYVGFSDQWGGGILHQGSELRGLGDVIDWAMRQSGVAYDGEAQSQFTQKLNSFLIDTVIAGDRLDLHQWCTNRLASVFPLRRLRGPSGYYFAFEDYTGGLEDAVAWLDADRRRVARVSSLTTRSETMYSSFRLRYKYGARAGQFHGTYSLGPEQGPTSADIGSAICARARGILGRDSPAPDIECELTWDDATAALILRYIAARDAVPLPKVEYVGSNLTYLQPMQVVALTDSAVYLNERPALIESIEVAGRESKLTLTLLPGLTRTT